MKVTKEMDLSSPECADKKEKVLSAYDSLEPGESMVIVNNVDPRPLLNSLMQKYPAEFSYDYLKQDTDYFKIQLNKSGACCGVCGG